MFYECPDGTTFHSHQEMCDHMIQLALKKGDYNMANYYQNEKVKMKRKQERNFPFFVAFIILGILSLVIAALSGDL